MAGVLRGGDDRAVVMALVAERFGLGELAGEPVRVAGGLSNEMTRVIAAGGEFAVKRMVVNAELPEFVGNVEAAFAVERRAWGAGVPMPEPVVDPVTGHALARVEGSLYRVHRWVDGLPAAGRADAVADRVEAVAAGADAVAAGADAVAGRAGAVADKDGAVAAAELLARIHAAGARRWAAPPTAPWDADRWGPDLADLARRVIAGPDRVLVVDSHRDLDRKNTLQRTDGTLIAIDWDAAGPTAAVHEAIALALDWSGGSPEVFAEAVRAFTRTTGNEIAAQEWVFGGWVAAQGGWLDYNADHRADTPLGNTEVTTTMAHLNGLAANLDRLVAALR